MLDLLNSRKFQNLVFVHIFQYIPFNSIHTSGDLGSFNFGNGYFNDAAISSEGTNASSNGIFEYDVPTGYTALSTKGLNL